MHLDLLWFHPWIWHSNFIVKKKWLFLEFIPNFPFIMVTECEIQRKLYKLVNSTHLHFGLEIELINFTKDLSCKFHEASKFVNTKSMALQI